MLAPCGGDSLFFLCHSLFYATRYLTTDQKYSALCWFLPVSLHINLSLCSNLVFGKIVAIYFFLSSFAFFREYYVALKAGSIHNCLIRFVFIAMQSPPNIYSK